MRGDDLARLAPVLARRGALCYLRGVRPLPLVVALLSSAAPLLIPGAARAHGGGAAMPAEVPAAPPGDGATAEGLMHELEARSAKDPDVAKVVAEPLKGVRRALERAHGARMAGDPAHAHMLDGLALEWAETGRDLEKAAAAETIATATSTKAHDVQTRADRARALLEETQARRGRAAAELERVQAEARSTAQGAADSESRRLEAARKGGGKGAAPPAPGVKAVKGKPAGKGGK